MEARFYLNGVAITGNSIPSGICEAYDASVALETAQARLAWAQMEMAYDRYGAISNAEYSAILREVVSAEKWVARLTRQGRI